MQVFSFENFVHVADNSVDDRLIPQLLHQTTNTEEIEFCMLVLDEAMNWVLTPEQKGLLVEYYWQNKTKKQMAEKRGVVHSTVVKRMQVAEEKLKDYLEFSLKVYRRCKKEN